MVIARPSTAGSLREAAGPVAAVNTDDGIVRGCRRGVEQPADVRLLAEQREIGSGHRLRRARARRRPPSANRHLLVW